MTTKTTTSTLSARAAARALGISHPTVLAMLEAKELPGKLVDGRWQIPATAVRKRADAALDRHYDLSQRVGIGAEAAAWLDTHWQLAMVDALAAEIRSARELVDAYGELKVQREREAAEPVWRERIENLDAVVARHHADVEAVESLRQFRLWTEEAKGTARSDIEQFDALHPIARAIIRARREDLSGNPSTDSEEA